MTMTLEELRAELSLVANNGCVTCSRENIAEWRDASDAAIKERDELRAELIATRAAAKRGMDAATAVSASNLRLARKALAESNPAALDEHLNLNERLTNELESAESELAALKQRIAKGCYVRSTRNGVIRTPVGWCEPNTDYTIITGANPPTETP